MLLKPLGLKRVDRDHPLGVDPPHEIDEIFLLDVP
jgi:hypothetical protein